MKYAIRRRDTNALQIIADEVQIILAMAQVESQVVKGTATECEVFIVAGQPLPTALFYAEPVEGWPQSAFKSGAVYA